MSTLPLLPDLPPVSDEAGAVPASSRNPLGFALPLLGAFALSRGGGGAEGLMEGLARGLQLGSIMRERQEATAQRKTLIEEQRAERRAALRRDFLTNVSRALAGIDDPDEFDQAKGQLRGVAAEFGVRPEELDVYAFPASKRSKLKRARAGAVLNQLITSHGAGKVFGELLDTTVDVAGESLSVRQLLKLAEFPIPKREVTRPVIEERPAPDVTGTGPGLALAGLPQRIQTGTETVTEEILPVISKRVTLGEYDPRFRNTPFARTQVPLDKDGDVDSAAIMRYYGEARNQGIPGFADPVSAAKGRFDQVMKERTDVRERMAEIRRQMDDAKTEEQFRAGVQAWKRFVENISRGKGYLGFTQVPFDVPTAVAQWKTDLAARRRKAGSATETLSAFKLDILQRMRAGEPVAGWERRFVGLGIEKEPERRQLDMLRAEEQKALLNLQRARARVNASTLPGALAKAEADLAVAQAEYDFWRQRVTEVMGGEGGVPLFPPPPSGPFRLRPPGLTLEPQPVPAPALPVTPPQRPLPQRVTPPGKPKSSLERFYR